MDQFASRRRIDVDLDSAVRSRATRLQPESPVGKVIFGSPFCRLQPAAVGGMELCISVDRDFRKRASLEFLRVRFLLPISYIDQ